ncbi:hypothetical protein PMSM_03930 [Paenibacillus macquariensis subsp. macquariensis]|uniref:Zinc-ribbon domain-containing protein n=1 Tax=Paenibacillus macquariensis TaxID=948756 RepID=A0ABY1JN51_9BACL|nr:hypothetical protein PMSM_03930 [Paenibacillus macquariensis subsp. macquariensis]SIQ48713.1 hypothetical protein SAMN05421578_102211 [Paenibacillus macquariensis]
MICLKCNFDNNDRAQFCDRCGILLYESFKAHLRKNAARTEDIIPSIPTQKNDSKSMILLISLSCIGLILFITILYAH